MGSVVPLKKSANTAYLEIINLLGDSAYLNGKLNKEFISEKIFYDSM